MNHKTLTALVLFSLVTSPAVVNAAATPKAGAKCTKVGSTATAGGIKFTCIKSGTKIVWNKGVAIPKPTPVATPTPTPSPESTPTPTPTPTPTATPTPNASPMIAIDPIRVKAFESVHSYKCGTTHPNINFNPKVSPTFSAQLKEKVDALLINDFNCFNDFFERTVPLQIFYVAQGDRDFVQVNVNPSINPGDVSHMNSIMNDIDSKKWGNDGMAGGFVNWNLSRTSLIMVIHATSGFNWQEKDNHLISHEFTHVMQQMYRSKIRSDAAGAWYNQIPGYMMEGGAEALGYIFEAKSPEALNVQMREIENYMSKDPSGIRFRNISSQTEMLSRMKEIISPSDDASYNIQYPLGGLICEFIIGTYGFERYLKLIQNTGIYLSFNDNLQNTIGKSQDQLLSDAAPYVYAQWSLAMKP